MPELPEVETIRRQLREKILGYKIVSLVTDLEKQFKPSFAVVKKGVVGATIEDVLRRAKLITFELSGGQYLLIHLRMTGSLLIRSPGDSEERWQHATFVIKKGTDLLEMRWIDLRQFGYLQLADREEKEAIWNSYGPEPLDGLEADALKSAFAKRSLPVKQALLDQKIVAGLGNIYANEALFYAGIHPKIPAKELSLAQVSALLSAIRQVLERYVDAHGRPGEFQHRLRVYGRKGQPCFKCGGAVEKIKLGGRGTFFCPVCQPLPASS